MSIKKIIFYFFAIVIIFGGQFLLNNGQLMGQLPIIKQKTINGYQVNDLLKNETAIIYFWAEWCGICKMMKDPVTAVLKDHPGVTVAVKSGDIKTIKSYLNENKLNWKVLGDPSSDLAGHFKVKGVPAVFFLNQYSQIKLTTTGYTSEIGLRFRLWLVSFL